MGVVLLKIAVKSSVLKLKVLGKYCLLVSDCKSVGFSIIGSNPIFFLTYFNEISI